VGSVNRVGSRANRVLVVEDERQILARLCEELPARRPEWNISFLTGAGNALRSCEDSEPDVAVLDLGGLGVFGLQLLRDLRTSHSGTACIVLAGGSGPELLLPAVPLARHCIAKPFDLDELELTIARTLALKERLDRPAMLDLIGDGQRLPATPLFSRLAQTIQTDDTGVGRLADVVAQDAEIVDRILGLVNSSFFGLTTPVRDPRDAIAILGPTTLQALVLNLEVFRAAFNSECSGMESEQLRAHAFSAADLASRFVLGTNAWNHARVAALLHDIGRVVFGAAAPEEYDRVLTLVRNTQQPLSEVERSTFGFTHADLGACAASLWGLPWTIVEPIAVHHDASPDWFDDAFDARHAVHTAELVLDELAAPGGSWTQELRATIARHGLEGDLGAWCREHVEPQPEQPRLKDVG